MKTVSFLSKRTKHTIAWWVFRLRQTKSIYHFGINLMHLSRIHYVTFVIWCLLISALTRNILTIQILSVKKTFQLVQMSLFFILIPYNSLSNRNLVHFYLVLFSNPITCCKFPKMIHCFRGFSLFIKLHELLYRNKTNPLGA